LTYEPSLATEASLKSQEDFEDVDDADSEDPVSAAKIGVAPNTVKAARKATATDDAVDTRLGRMLGELGHKSSARDF